MVQEKGSPLSSEKSQTTLVTNNTTPGQRSKYRRYCHFIAFVVALTTLIYNFTSFVTGGRLFHGPVTLSIEQRVEKILSETPLIGRREQPSLNQ